MTAALLERERTIEARHEDEIAESVTVTMKAPKDFFGLKSASRQGRLRSVGAEFGHIVARNITDSKDPQENPGRNLQFLEHSRAGRDGSDKRRPFHFHRS